jgi:hypothetical protein
MSKRSVVDMGQVFFYASPEGIVAIGPGVNKIVTEALFTREDWAAYAPASITAFMWVGHYLGFYDTGTKQAGFIFDPRTGDWTDLDFYATAGYRDPKTGILYLQVGADIVEFATSTGSVRSMNLVSRRESFKLGAIAAVKVLAPSYPVSVQVAYPELGQTVTASVTSHRPQRVTPPETLVDTADIRVYGAKGATVVYLASTLEELPL